MPQRKTVFVSYCRRNKRWLQRLRVHLTPYERSGVVEIWDDTKIAPGDRWHAEIQHAIDRAAASIVLVSADFLASDFVAAHELPKLLRKAEKAGARILPIIVEPCELAIHPELASFQALNSVSEPLAAMSRAEAEHVLVRTVSAIGNLFATPDHGERTVSTGRSGRTESTSGEIFEQLQSASVALAVLWVLGKNASGLTITELERILAMRSRKRAYEAVDRLVRDGWIEKLKSTGLTRFRMTKEGGRQMQRLAAACDGPVRRAVESR